MPISGVDPTPRPTAVYASNAALPRRPQDSLPSGLLGFGRTRLALASSHQLLLSHPASGFPTGFSPRHTAGPRVRCVLPKQWAMADAPSSTDRRPSSPQVKASSEVSGCSRVFQAHRQSPILGSVQSAPEVRALSSASIPRPPRSYGPLRLPSDPPPVRRGVASPSRDGSPPMTRITLPACRAPYPGGSRRVLASIASPLTRPSPFPRRVGIRIFTFEASSGFTRVTARWIAQPPTAAFVTRLRPGRLPGQAARQLQINRQLSG